VKRAVAAIATAMALLALATAPVAASPKVNITTPCEHLRVEVTGLEPGQRINVIIFDTDNFRTANQGGVAVFSTKLPATTLGVQVRDASGNDLVPEKIVTIRSCGATLPFTGSSSTWPMLIIGIGLIIGGTLLVRRRPA
jgi:LPXTG-motif cell wall-anchored protein